ncbi:Tail fiber domain protein [Pseudomonas caricapapayae]|uniref:Tail fiber domain protein n=1 Tax=Pseudomonas caricapapayae TaxID=46678 RepID=A0A0P9KLJ3_9PSED|nr:tail fiber domain-containing protein [Pseudomonas caricapapayae]KAA8692007.1 tail fiber domain-containing protein [Pseudomonas caricapapayae]KPW57077.1 Tail fiber domain protein [Pseudomonas caricapapayae]RMM11407.1 Tail fiber domain protein [Pseudomonas caricapapayae]RMV91527.1 Tail fiber domain protein [Pseudomonas caricapapayae]
MPWSRNGTVAVTQNSTTVTGTGTTFASTSRVGDAFNGPDGRRYEVANIVSETVLAILPAYAGATVSGAAYSIEPVQGYPKALTDSFNSVNQLWGGKLAALGTTGNFDTLPIAKGGTGRTDGRALLSEVGVQQASALYNNQGLYLGWNSGSQGEGHFIVNRGGGAGGFTWRSVNAGNTETGPSMSYSYGGVLSVPQLSVTAAPIAVASGGTGGNTQATARAGLGMGPENSVSFGSIELSGATPYIDFHYNKTATDYDVRLMNDVSGTLGLIGRFASSGTWCRTGFGGSRGTTVYNFNWTGNNVDVYIDNTYVGTMTLFTSDYRIKKLIKDLKVPSYLDRIDAYRLVTYERKVFGDVFRGDGRVYQGLIAHEAQEVNPLAVTGEKDGVDENGDARIQQLDPMALITDLMGAVKELRAELLAVKASKQSTPTVS